MYIHLQGSLQVGQPLPGLKAGSTTTVGDQGSTNIKNIILFFTPQNIICTTQIELQRDKQENGWDFVQLIEINDYWKE